MTVSNYSEIKKCLLDKVREVEDVYAEPLSRLMRDERLREKLGIPPEYVIHAQSAAAWMKFYTLGFSAALDHVHLGSSVETIASDLSEVYSFTIDTANSHFHGKLDMRNIPKR